MGIKKVSTSYLLMWAISYITVAILYPEVGGVDTQNEGVLIYSIFGAFLIFGALTASNYIKVIHNEKSILNLPGRIILFVLALFSVGSGIASWTGVALWNVPFEPALFQVSMAFADLIAAALMFELALFEK